MIRAAFLLLMLSGAAALSGPAAAQIQCGPRDKVVKQIEDAGFQLQRVHVGNEGRYVDEFFGLARTGHWIVLRVTAQGLACKLRGGSGWRARWPA